MPVLTRTKKVKIKDFCEMLGISKSLVSKYIKEGMPHEYIGKRGIRLPLEEAEKWIQVRFN